MNYFDLPNLASPLLGSQILFATDEWFAAAENMIKDEDAVWKQDEYTTFGKWMDGWETRRRRTEGHDWCVVQLGIPGIIRAIEVDTAFFTGNFSPKVSILGALHLSDNSAADALRRSRRDSVAGQPEIGRMGMKASDAEWTEVQKLQSESWPVLVELTPLGAGYEDTRKNLFQIPPGHGPIQYLRINMGPDGGIARVRVYGEVVVQPERIPADRDIDLAAVEHGGMAIACSNKHYGHPRNLIAPGRGNCMGDGWETARQPRRPAVYQKGADGLMVLPGCDWSVLKLGVPGNISQIEVDTHFYKGNYPESCTIEGCLIARPGSEDEASAIERDLMDESQHDRFGWRTLLPRTRLGPDARHFFDFASHLQEVGVVSHVKVTMFPDGGIMRLRILGRKAGESKL
jgi:allantoicase